MKTISLFISLILFLSNTIVRVDGALSMVTNVASPHYSDWNGRPALVAEGSGEIAGENIHHPNGNIFDQILLTGESITVKAREGQITRVSFMDENEDIVQAEFSGS